MKLYLSRMLLMIALATVLVAWPSLLVLLTTCTADTDWCPDGGTAPQGSTPDHRRSEPGDPPPCPPP